MFKRVLLTLLMVLSGNQFCHAAAACPNPLNYPMTQINSYKDEEPFAGHVVAYITNILYIKSSFGISVEPSCMLGGCSLGYGFIEKPLLYWVEGPCHNMQRLLMPGYCQAQCLLSDPQIKCGVFYMRLATKEELEQMRQAILQDQAVFEFVSDKDKALAMLLGSEGLEHYNEDSGLSALMSEVHLS